MNPNARMHEQEKSFMVDLDRENCEIALNSKIGGAFMLRPKDENSFVVSVNKSNTDKQIEHYVVHRVAGMYQKENNSGVAITNLHEFLIDLRTKEKLPKLVFFSSQEATKPVEEEGEVAEEDLLRVSTFIYRCCIYYYSCTFEITNIWLIMILSNG